jgi:hypothetical protein
VHPMIVFRRRCPRQGGFQVVGHPDMAVLWIGMRHKETGCGTMMWIKERTIRWNMLEYETKPGYRRHSEMSDGRPLITKSPLVK